MADWAQKVLVLCVDREGDTQAIRIDKHNHAIVTIETEHEKIHDHKGFSCSAKYAISAGASLDILMINPALNFPHLRFFSVTSTGGPCDVEVYEDTTISATGTACVARVDHNRNDPVIPNLGIYSGAALSAGAQLSISGITGEKKVAGTGGAVPNEWILKQAATSMIRVTNNSGSDQTLWTEMFWYE
jgi:hypothetical protein